MIKPKYHRRVFSGKDLPLIGLDQGKSVLYRGDGVHHSWNTIYDASMQQRDGQVEFESFSGGVNFGMRTPNTRVVCEGTGVWAEAV